MVYVPSSVHKNFAEIVHPLNELLAKHKLEKLRWENKHEEAFSELKARLTSKPVLFPPQPDKPFEIYADSSAHTLGAVLLQRADSGNETPHVVSYASRKLSGSEQRFLIVERELLAIVFALAKFRNLVYGRKIYYVRTIEPWPI